MNLNESLIWGPAGAPPRAERVEIGHLAAELHGADVRWLTMDGVEVVRRLYVAVRDHNWDTIPPSQVEREVVRTSEWIGIRLRAGHFGTVRFEWSSEIRILRSGEVTFEFDGTHLERQRYNRIGIVVHHPPERMRGSAYSLRGPAGPANGVLPVSIGPQAIVNGRPTPLIPTFDRIEIRDDVVACRFEFEGDLFELEDQRNWTDGSFKTYSTPLSSAWPFTAEPGELVRQSLRLEVERKRPRTATPALRGSDRVSVKLSEPTGPVVPAIGFDHPPSAPHPAPQHLELLQAVAPAFLRLELGRDTTVAYLDEGTAVARRLGWPVELSVNGDVDDLPRVDLQLLEGLLNRVAVTRRATGTADAEQALRVRDHLGIADGVPLVVGTNAYFVDINRDRPVTTGCDGVTYPICPQVHASDIASMVEGVVTQTDTVETARALFGLPVHVGPIALAPRYNPNATEAVAPSPIEWPPPSVDPRQPTLFAAAWTVASVAALTAAGAASATYYQLVGWRGILGDPSGPFPEHPPRPDMVFPAFHVFADLARMSGRASPRVEVSEPMRVAAVAGVDESGRVAVLVANLSGQPTPVMIEGVARAPRVRRLSADSALQALDPSSAMQWRSATESLAEPALTLAPFETALISEGT